MTETDVFDALKVLIRDISWVAAILRSINEIINAVIDYMDELRCIMRPEGDLMLDDFFKKWRFRDKITDIMLNIVSLVKRLSGFTLTIIIYISLYFRYEIISSCV